MTAGAKITKNINENNLQNLGNVKDVNEYNNKVNDTLVTQYIGTDYTYTHQIVWINATVFFLYHVLASWGLVKLITGEVSLITFLWTAFVMFCSTEGVTVGAHRCFTHKSFKAKPLLKAILIMMQTIAGQNSVYIWCRDHRLHHRYSDTDADPHNSKRGFFFCHIGWLMTKKHPYVIKYGKHIDMSDLQADSMVMFQWRHFLPLYLILSIIIPVVIPIYHFGENWWNALLVCYFFRYVSSLHGTWLVNSAAHLSGTRPYDQNLQPVESWFVSFLSLGEGWHNYHHAFPWDYKAAELSNHFNFSASLIQFFEKIGLAYDLKTASPEMVANRIIRTGDGSHYKLGNTEARESVTAWGPLHPLNPTYNSTLPAPDAILKPGGLPLYHDKDVLNVDIQERPVLLRRNGN